MGIRTRATLAATAITALAFTAGVLLFLAATRGRIELAISEDARDRAVEIADLIRSEDLTSILAVGDPELLTQVIDEAGQVVASDQVIAGLPAMFDVDRQGPVLEVVRVDALAARGVQLDDASPFVVAVYRLDQGRDLLFVVVVGSLGDASEALDAVIPLLAGGVPVLVVLVGVLTWIITGRALRPVAQIGAEAHEISASALDRRVPVPDSKDEIHRLALTINEMLDRLEGSVRRQRQFVSDSSHELKSPLTAIKTILELTERGGESLPAETWSDLQAEVGRLERLTDDLLYLASVDEARPHAPFVDVDLDQVVAAEIASVGRRTDLSIDTSALRPVRVRGDRHHLSRLVRNLLDNAVRFAATSIWVETREQDGSTLLLISDDGPGVPENDRRRVFERFVRLDESRDRHSGGSGLGLAVAAAIAAVHHGELGMIEGLHGGASFQLRLPLGDDSESR